jgi:hypothetical protein
LAQKIQFVWVSSHSGIWIHDLQETGQ